MKEKILLLLLLSNFFIAAQTIEDAWLFLKDKPEAATFFSNPLLMLSQRALDRRSMQEVSLDEKDVPIHFSYYTTIKNTEGVAVLGKSKWLNAIHIQATEETIEALVNAHNFIKTVEFANKNLNTSSKKRGKQIPPHHQNKIVYTQTDFNYGSASGQIEMLSGDFLHQQSLTGKNQIIAVIDAGFPNVNTLAAFKRIRDNNQILGGYNFVDRNENFYTRDSHGTLVLSTIAGYLENKFVGTAPDASFYLFITEKAESETVLEETLWVEAAEQADSLGVNILNTSLGYTTFDNPEHSYTYADMDGKTTFISRGAEIAASKGMLVVNSAGNSGNSAWKFIGAPADAPSVISVGAVNADKEIAGFSSFGPTADGRIKPEILAQGSSAAAIHHISGEVIFVNGTSFSGPIMAGLIACLNQVIPSFIKSQIKTKQENSSGFFNQLLKRGLYESADRYNNPTTQHGYGIPNFEQAQAIYFSLAPSLVEDNFFEAISIFPNPVSTNFKIDGFDTDLQNYTLQIFDVLGKEIYQQNEMRTNTIDISHLKNGLYLLRISKDNQQKTIKIIKQ